jgi:predicted ATPase
VPSLLLLQFFARKLHDSRILVLGTYRDIEARGTPAVPEHLSNLLRDGHPIHLGGLSEAEVERLIANTAGLAPKQAVVGAVHRVTEGKPFFIDGVVRLLVAHGELDSQAEVTAESLKIPDEVRESVRSRLRPLSEETTHLLTIASLTGREFDRSALELASGLPLERVLTLHDNTCARSPRTVRASASPPCWEASFARWLRGLASSTRAKC